MRAVVLLFGLTLFAGPAYATGCGPDLEVEAKSLHAIRAAMEALDWNPDRAAKVNAIATLYAEGRRALRTGHAGRELVRSLRTITPRFFASVFDADERVRRAAAFAIAGFLKADAFDDDLAQTADAADPATESLVRDQIEAYLATREAHFFQYVHVEEAVRTPRGWQVKASAEVKDELPLRLDGRAPRTLRPRWLSARPHLRLTVHTNDGSLYRRLDFTGRNGRDLNLRGDFDLELSADADLHRLRIFVDFTVDDHALERMVINGRRIIDSVGDGGGSVARSTHLPRN